MALTVNARLVEAVVRKLEDLARALDKASVAEFIELYRRPRRMLYLSFASGVVRGFGIAVGFTIVSAVFLTLLARVAALNLPVIGEFIAGIARIVQRELAVGP